jgi:Ca2+/Na+ antiporter
MSITLPGLRRRPAAWGGQVRRSTERPLSALPTVVEFVAAPVAILLGVTFFTSAVEILGRRLGLRQGAVGSRLAGGDTEGGAEIGVGAILAASATEMPEKSTLSSGYGWQSHTLTLRNMTGVMILQSTIPSRSG